MKIVVNQETCIGCGMCINTDPDNFDYNKDGYAVLKNNNITDLTLEAKNYCPVDAITIVNEEEKK